MPIMLPKMAVGNAKEPDYARYLLWIILVS